LIQLSLEQRVLLWLLRWKWQLEAPEEWLSRLVAEAERLEREGGPVLAELEEVAEAALWELQRQQVREELAPVLAEVPKQASPRLRQQLHFYVLRRSCVLRRCVRSGQRIQSEL